MKSHPQISISVADLPLNVSLDEVCELAKNYKCDGVEVLLGYKTMSGITRLESLSKKYSLKILSIHTPQSIGRLVAPIEKVFKIARYFDALLVLHPLKKYALNSPRQHEYFAQYKKLQEYYDVTIGLENMGNESTLPIYKKFSRSHLSTIDLSGIGKAALDYDFSVTLDTAHVHTSKPHTLKAYNSIFPLIRNIHISDFNEKKQHLGLGLGVLEYTSYLHDLRKRRYSGIITIELTPRFFANKSDYFQELIRSLQEIHAVFSS